MKHVLATIGLCALVGALVNVADAKLPLEINAIVAHVPVTGNPPTNFVWSRDGSHYAYARPGPTEAAPPRIFVHDMRSGRERLFAAAETTARGSRSREIAQLVWSPDATRIAYSRGGALAVARADGTGARTIALGADDAQWSPDGSRVAYVAQRDVYVMDLVTGERVRCTHALATTRINGDPDWLYSEEMDVAHAFAWSPDGRSIAYLSFDESHVTDFPIQRYLDLPVNVVEHQRYPLAGEANPRVSLHVVGADGRNERTLYDGAARDEYLVSFAWTPDSRQVVDEILDRPQHHLRLEAFARANGARRTILRESDPRFVDVAPAPKFVAGGRAFLWISERAGIASLYRVSTADGRATRLSGTIPIASIEAVDESARRAYVAALYPTRREHALLAIALSGAHPPVNLTPERGSHFVSVPERGTSFIDTSSTFATPPTVRRRSRSNAVAVTLFAPPSLARYALGTSTLLTIDSPYGKLDAGLVLPPDFDASKRYPVVVNVYGGPLPVAAGATADDRFPGLWPHVLAGHGIVSLYINGPASRHDRTANVRTFTGAMGEVAIRGPLAAYDWLARTPFVDAKRIGLFGWSYGGYLTAYTLTHAPGLFRSGIAGAPPADWRFYDSAYTERYMGSPRAAGAAYDRTSVIAAARRLRARLLILQGSSDDNVHLANSIALLDAFVRAGRQVDYFVFPGARHGPRGVANLRYLDTKMLEWWQRTL